MKVERREQITYTLVLSSGVDGAPSRALTITDYGYPEAGITAEEVQAMQGGLDALAERKAKGARTE